MSLRYLPEHAENALLALGRLRNLLVHEYMSSPPLFLEALLAARDAVDMLFGVVEAVGSQAKSVGLIQG